MEIKKLFERQSIQNANQTAKKGAVSAYGNQAKIRQAAGEDSVNISRLSRQLSRIAGILDEDALVQQDRVQALKSKYEAGELSFNSVDVAQSIASYVNDQ